MYVTIQFRPFEDDIIVFVLLVTVEEERISFHPVVNVGDFPTRELELRNPTNDNKGPRRYSKVIYHSI